MGRGFIGFVGLLGLGPRIPRPRDGTRPSPTILRSQQGFALGNGFAGVEFVEFVVFVE